MTSFESGLSRCSFAMAILRFNLIVLTLMFPFASSALDQQQTGVTVGGVAEQGKTTLENSEKTQANFVVEENTKLPVVLDSVIGSDKSKNGEKITGHLSEDLNLEGTVVLSAGSKVEERIRKF